MSRSAACNLQPLSCSKKDDPSPLGRAEAPLHCAAALIHSVRRGARGGGHDREFLQRPSSRSGNRVCDPTSGAQPEPELNCCFVVPRK